MAALIGTGGGCRNAQRPDDATTSLPRAEPAGARAAPPSNSQPLPTTSATSAAAAPDGARAVIQVAGKSVVVTLADAQSLQAALRSQLEHSKLPLREHLLQAAQGAIQIEPASVSIGRWALRDYGGKLCLYHRGPTPAVFHVAEVTGSAGNWSVKEPAQGEILMRH